MPKEVSFDEKKALQNATNLFWFKGYNGTSMDDLTKATGLSRSSIYNSFGDKQSLFIQCLSFYKNDLLDKVMEVLVKQNSPLKKIETVFKLSIDGLLSDKDRKGCLIVNTTTELANIEGEILSFMKKFSEQIEGLFQTWIKEGQESGEISKTFSPVALARHLFNSYQGIKVIAQTTNDRKTLDDILKVTLSVLRK